MLRHRAASGVLVLVLVLVAVGAGCTPGTLSTGARRTADGQVEAHFRSCSGAAMVVTLEATDQPMPPPSAPRSTGTTIGIRWDRDDTVWTGTVDGDETSVLIPVALRPDRTYRLAVNGAPGESTQLSSEPYLFVADDLVTDGVTSSAYRGAVPVTPEEFAASTEHTCYQNGLGPYLWFFVAFGVIACTILGAITYAFFQIGRHLGRPKRPPPPPPVWAASDPGSVPPSR